MKCKWCNDTAFRKQGRIWLCKKHYRFQQMRVHAKRHGKYVPDYEELESLWISCGNICPVCQHEFNWLSKEGTKTVITLQHDRNGSIRFLCRSCNTRHASFKDDSFYDADSGCRICPRCKRKLPISDYSADSANWNKHNTYCRKCRTEMHAEWVNKNKEECNAKRREYYHKRIANGNPIPR